MSRKRRLRLRPVPDECLHRAPEPAQAARSRHQMEHLGIAFQVEVHHDNLLWRSSADIGICEDRAWRHCVNLRRSEEHTSELQSLMRNPYAIFCLKKKHKI